MSLTDHLQHHLILCQELHQLALEENQFLKSQKRVPDAALLDRKRHLLAELDHSLAALKAENKNSALPGARPDESRKEVVEKARAKLLQILHVDRENEQLLLRYSLGSQRKSLNENAPPPPPPTSHVRRLYERLG